MSLTKREKQRILEACEFIDTDRVLWSCVALETGKYFSLWSYDLAEKYRDFYFEFPLSRWAGLDQDNTRKMRDHRIMLLLLFLAADGELG